MERRRWLLRVVMGAACVLAVLLVRQWLYASTYRLYLDPQQVQDAPPTLSRQRFEIAGNRVEPQILSAPVDSVSFAVDIPARSELRVTAVPVGAASVEIALVENGRRRVLGRRTVTGATEIVEPVPPLFGRLELSNQGELRWLDPRLVRAVSALPKTLGLLALCALAFTLRMPGPGPRSARGRSLLFAVLTAGLASSAGLLLLEGSLRLLGSRLPGWISVQRRDLGERQPDPRWQDSPRYGSRLAPSVRSFCEWQQGDIVRMGFLPPDLVSHPPYRFAFETDAEGFRNASHGGPPEEVAALGDSFTDAMTLPAELSWPSRLAKRLETGVRNYGTAGFGPQQELLALQEYALPRRPRVVVVGFFAGNDLQDAERFARLESEGRHPTSAGGWRFKQVIARFDQLYVVSLAEGIKGLWHDGHPAALASVQAAGPADWSGEDPRAPAASGPSFERGLFALPVNGRTLRFAFLPAYLDGLRYSPEELRESRRWALTRQAYLEMQRQARAQGSELTVMFIPSKAQVYLPLLAGALAPQAIDAALRASLQEEADPPSYATLMRHRLALNGLMREFCAESAIPFLDLTPALEAQVRTGVNVYFPDDSHWNAEGHAVAATSLARWLDERRLSARSPGPAAPPRPRT